MTTTVRYYTRSGVAATAPPTPTPASPGNWTAVNLKATASILELTKAGNFANGVTIFTAPGTFCHVIVSAAISGQVPVHFRTPTGFREASGLYNAIARIVVHIVDAAGAEVAHLGTFTHTTEVDTSTGFLSRVFDQALALGSYTPTAGDRLVFDFGLSTAFVGSASMGVGLGTFSPAPADASLSDGLNTAASTSSWIEVDWEDLPDPPTGLNQTGATTTSVDMSFTAPAAGGTPESYEYRIGGGSPTDIGLVTSFTISGLTESTTYDVEVRTVSSGLFSAWTSVVEATTASPPPPPPSGDWSPGGCATDWRVEALDIQTGARLRILNPVAFNFEELLNEVGSGSVTLNVRDVRMQDIWPHAVKIAFLRISGPDASPVSPVCEWVGLVERVNATSKGTVTLGLKSVEEYLAHRMIDADVTFIAEEQTAIGADLVDLASTGGIGLLSDPETSAVTRDRVYLAADHTPLLTAIQDLTQVIDGPDYVLVHDPSGHPTTVQFLDTAGATGLMNARRGLTAYSLDVDASEHVTRVLGQGGDPAITYDADLTPVGGVVWERSEAYNDVLEAATVQEKAEGSVTNDFSPTALPEVTVAGVNLIAPLSLGDVINLTMGHGALQYKGGARLVGIAWSSSNESPTQASLTFVPGTTGVGAILEAPHTEVGCF